MLGKMRQKVLENTPTQKQRGDLFDSVVQNPVALKLIREKKYDQVERLVSELIDEVISFQS